jgi:hypothetical protein
MISTLNENRNLRAALREWMHPVVTAPFDESPELL